MLPNESQSVRTMINTLCMLYPYSRRIDDSMWLHWIGVLSPFSIEEITTAVHRWGSEKADVPVPATFSELLLSLRKPKEEPLEVHRAGPQSEECRRTIKAILGSPKADTNPKSWAYDLEREYMSGKTLNYTVRKMAERVVGHKFVRAA